jgi:SAM-dependent methyltransferase
MDPDRRRRWTERHRTATPMSPPSPFVLHALELLAEPAPRPRRALDVACGRGRHALALAEHGYVVTAVDYAVPAVQALRAGARARGLAVDCLAADVTTWPLPRDRFDLVVVVNFLERALFASLRTAVAPGGALLFETFVAEDGDEGGVPVAFRLRPGELDAGLDDWEILARHASTDAHDGRPTPRAGVLARRPRIGVAH